MKKVLSLVAVGALLLAQAPNAGAVTYTVSATVPAASAVTINAYSISTTTANAPRVAVSGNTLDFGTLTYQPATGNYLPSQYFLIETALGTGAGNQQVTVSYTEGTNPNGSGHGLGWKTVATFNKVTGSTTEATIAAHGKKMLKDLTNEVITGAELGNSALRIYVGAVTKDPSASPVDPAASELITNSDKPGAYSGSLTVTATVV